MFYRPNTIRFSLCALCALSLNLQAAPDYEPPATGSPTHRAGAGTRSDSSSSLQLQLFSNPSQHKVISAQPLLYWKVTQTLTKPAKFLLQKLKSGESVLELDLPVKKAGVQIMDLSHYNVVLDTDTVYEWAITIPPQGDLGSPLVMGATILRTHADEKLQQALLNSTEQANIYSQAGLWYEALAHVDEVEHKTKLLEAAKLKP